MLGTAEEEVAVWVTAAGAPARFEWAGQSYVVCGTPIPWVNQSPWWAMLGDRAPGQGPVEQAMWTVRALQAGTGTLVTADLAVTTGDWWRLTRIDD